MDSPRIFRNRRQLRLSTNLRRGVAAVAACFMVGQPFANPVNPTVVSGTATFSQSGNTLTVTNSNGAIINWDKFSIKAGETTHFAQPSVSSAVLNRVLNDPSAIYGTLSSNGRVWLINPAGIMVGASGRIDTAGFVASTLNVRNEDFLAGRKLFENTPGAASVINQGEIRTPSGGSVYLVGSNVSNEGIIHTPAGETILAAGTTVSLIDSATPGVKVEITGAEGNSTNLGSITAEAGRVGIVGVIVRNSGLVNASSVVSEGGRVFLKASRDAYVDGSGRIVTTGTKGGTVEVLGNRVALTDQAAIDASGAMGGGQVLVGGDYQGQNPVVANAAVTYVGAGANIKADATEVGAGGTAIVWADDTTRMHGRISARGGAQGGNGGFVETSGKRYLDVTGARVDTTAGRGAVGQWLLDPTDIGIVAGAGTTTGIDAFGVPTASSATVYAADINTNLLTTDVMFSTTSAYGGFGNITIYGGVNISNASGVARTFGLEANGGINVQYGSLISGGATSPLSVVMKAYGGSAMLAGTIKTFGGDVAIAARDGIILGDGANTTSGTFGIIARRDGASGGTQTYDTAGYGGRILFDADSDRNGVGSFVMYGGSFVGTTSNAHLIDATGNIGAYGSAKVAVGVIAADVELANTASIKLNYDATASAGAPYGGGDIAFLPTTTGDIRIGNFSSAAPHFTLDNAELKRIILPANGATNCGTGQEGCRLWIGGAGIPNDPIAGALPNTIRNIKLDQADFTFNGTTVVPKRVHLVTATGDINDLGNGAGYYGAKAGHLSLYGGSGIGGYVPESGTDGVEFIANSVVLKSPSSGIRATSVGGGDVALRSVNGAGDINLKVLSGGVTLIPYFSGQSETTPSNFNLTVDGDIRFAAYGGSYTIAGPLNTFTESAPGSATIRAGGTLNLTSTGGSVHIAGDQAASSGLVINANNDITVTDGGLATSGAMSLASYGDIVLTGANRGTIVKSGGMMNITAANLRAYGGNAINPGGFATGTTQAFLGSTGVEDLSGQGAGVAIKSAMAQNIDIASGEILLQAGSANNGGGYGGLMYGGTVGIWSTGTQNIQAANIKLFGGAGGHDNNAEIQSFGDQAITLYGGILQLAGGGGVGGFNNQARVQHGQWNAGVGSGTGNQLVLVYGGGTIDLVGGSGTGTQGYYGSDCYAVLGDACRGGSNDARIENVFAAQTINFASGGQLNITGGSAGTKNSASIEAQTSAATTQQILGNANITLTGGSAGGSALAYGGENHDLSNDAGIYSDGSSSQTILANNITIHGGSANVGGAGISNESGVMLMVQTVGNLTMTGGSSSAASPYGGAAYIANRDNGLVALLVGGNLNATSGSGSSSPVLIGSIEGQGSVQISGANINLTANASFVAVGSKAAAYGASVTMLSPGNISFNDSTTNPNGKIFIGSDTDGVGSPTMVSVEAHGNVTVGSVGGHGVSIGTATAATNTASTVSLVAGPVGYGGNLVINSGASVSGYGGVLLAANNAYGGTGDITVNGGSLVSGGPTGYIRIYAGRDVDLAGTVNSFGPTMNAVDIQAGVNGSMAPTVNAYGGNIDLNASTITGYGGISLIANNVTGGQGALTQTGGSLDASMAGANINIRTGGNATLAGPIHAGGGIDIQAGMNGVAIPSGYGGDLSIGGNLTADAGMGVNLLAKGGSSAHGDLTQSAGTIYGATVNVNGLRNVVLNGNLTAGTGMLNATAGDTMMMGYGGNLTVGSGVLQGYGGITLLAINATGAEGNITQTGGALGSAGMGAVVVHGGGNVDLAGVVSAMQGSVDVQAGVNGLAAMPTAYGGSLTTGGAISGYGGVTLAAYNSTGAQGDISMTSSSVTAGGPTSSVKIYAGRNVSLSTSVNAISTMPGAIDIQAGVNGSVAPTMNSYGGNIALNTSAISGYGGVLLVANNPAGGAGALSQTGGTIDAGAAGANVTIRTGGSATLAGLVHAGGGIDIQGGMNGFAIPSGYGGNLSIGGNLTAEAGTGVQLLAKGGSNASGSISQTAGTISGPMVAVSALKDVSLQGSVLATVGQLDVAAGDAVTYQYGGNLSIGSGTLQGYGGVTLFAVNTTGAQGDITQAGGTIASPGSGSIVIHGGRNVSINANVSSASGIVDVMAGVNGNTLAANPYGGDLSFGVGGVVSATAKVDLFAKAGTQGGSGGNVSQNGSITSTGPITLRGDRVVTINGSLVSTGSAINLRSGYDSTPFYGGNLTFGAGSNVAAYGGNLEVLAIGASESAGTILQSGGRLYASSDLTLAADGSVLLNGIVETPAGMNLNVFAGVDNYVSPANPIETSAYGGNAVLGSGSTLTGGHVGLFANHGDFPDGTTGRVTQAAGSSVTALGTSLNIGAAGLVSMSGTLAANGAAGVSINAGYDLVGGGPAPDFADRTLFVNSLTSNLQNVTLTATGPLQANLSNVGTLVATIGTNSNNGGISISHTGAAAPGSVALTDDSLANRAVGFQHFGSDLVLGGSYSFQTGASGSNLVAAPTNQLIYNGALLGGTNIQLSGGSALTFSSALNAGSATLGLSSGGVIHVNSGVFAANAVLAAPTINVVSGQVSTSGDTLFFGSQINIGSGLRTTKVSAGNVLFRNSTLGTGTLNLAGEVYSPGQIEFNLGSVLGTSGGALYASSATSTITGIVSGDITLDGAVFAAGDNIDLKLTGPTSTLSLLNGGYLLADMSSPPASIFLDFPARSSGGLVISGAGSGLFVGDTSTPATAANGSLHVTFDPASTTTSTPVINDLISSTTKITSTETPTESNSSPTVVTSTSSTQTSLTLGGTAGGTEGTFGAESTPTGSSGTSGTTGGSTGSGTGDSGTGTGGGTGDQTASTDKDSGSGDSKDSKNSKDDKDEKDKKDKKDKKSDDAKDEKKDEKPAQKKVAQCS
jgi:filamentous hemagglutinin family protein